MPGSHFDRGHNPGSYRPETIAFEEVRKIRIAPDGVHITLKDGSTMSFRTEDLEFEMPNGEVVDVDQLLEAIRIKGVRKQCHLNNPLI